MPSKVTASRTIKSRVATRSTRDLAAASPCLFLYSPRMGTKACEKAPSANRRRSRFGSLKATMKASVIMPAPKMRAMTKSRTKPRTLETRVMPLTVARDLSRFIFIGLLCLGCCAGPAGGVILRCSMRQGAWRLLKAGFGRRKIALRSRRLFCKILRFRLIH